MNALSIIYECTIKLFQIHHNSYENVIAFSFNFLPFKMNNKIKVYFFTRAYSHLNPSYIKGLYQYEISSLN